MTKKITPYKLSLHNDDFMIIVEPKDFDPKTQQVLVSLDNQTVAGVYNPVTKNITAKITSPPSRTYDVSQNQFVSENLRVKVFVNDLIGNKIIDAKLQEFVFDAQTMNYIASDVLLNTSSTILGVPIKNGNNINKRKILNIDVNQGKSLSGINFEFNVDIYLSPLNFDSPFIATQTVELEINGYKTIAQSYINDNKKVNQRFAKVKVAFSTIIKLSESYNLTARILENPYPWGQASITDSMTIKVLVKSDGSVRKIIDSSGNSQTLITLEQLISIGVRKKLAQKYIDALNRTFIDYNVNTPLRMSHFLAQIMQESGSFYYTAETGVPDTAYGGFKGRGLIQITGRENYTQYQNYENEDFTSNLTNKKKLENLPYSVRSTGWFWSIQNELNTYADNNDFIFITRLINGGLNHYDNRLRYLKRCFEIFEIEFVDYEFANSNAYNEKRASFAWGLWHDPDLNKDGCSKDKEKAIEGYNRFVELAPDDFDETNWYLINKIRAFSNIKYIKKGKSYVNVLSAAKQRLEKLREL